MTVTGQSRALHVKTAMHTSYVRYVHHEFIVPVHVIVLYMYIPMHRVWPSCVPRTTRTTDESVISA